MSWDNNRDRDSSYFWGWLCILVLLLMSCSGCHGRTQNFHFYTPIYHFGSSVAHQPKPDKRQLSSEDGMCVCVCSDALSTTERPKPLAKQVNEIYILGNLCIIMLLGMMLGCCNSWWEAIIFWEWSAGEECDQGWGFGWWTLACDWQNYICMM